MKQSRSIPAVTVKETAQGSSGRGYGWEEERGEKSAGRLTVKGITAASVLCTEGCWALPVSVELISSALPIANNLAEKA